VTRTRPAPAPSLGSAVLVLVVVLTALAAVPPPAPALDASDSELRALVARAGRNPDALAQLRRIDRVDGRPVDLRGALAGATPKQVRARLETLNARSEQADSPPGTAGRSREQARAVLRQRRFAPASVPRPLHGALERLGRTVRPVRRAAAELLDRLDGLLPGGQSVAWSFVGGLVLLMALLGTRRLVGRRTALLACAQQSRAQKLKGADPRDLERDAEAAQRDGRYEDAVRLLFRAGLLRLDARGIITFRPSMSSGEVSRALGSEDFDRLASRFDAVVYGGAAAVPEDAAFVRERWQSVLDVEARAAA